MSAGLTEESVEGAAAERFEGIGYEARRGVDLEATDGRTDYSQTILPQRTARTLRRLNPHLDAETVEQVVRSISRPPHTTLIGNNRWFHGLLTDGVPVEYRDAKSGELRGGRARLIDFDDPRANEWLVVRQLIVKGANDKAVRPDLTVYLNGLPVALVELKDPTDAGADLFVAADQLRKYRGIAPDLFVPNILLAVSDGALTRVGSLTAGNSRYMPWRPENGGAATIEALIADLFAPAAFLDYLRSCIAFEEDAKGNVAKKIGGYHQFRAVRKTRASVLSALKPPGKKTAPSEKAGDRDWRGGVLWHTQGSGKSLTMLFLAGALIRDPRLANPTIVVVTDRNDLDDQLFGTFASGRDLLRQEPIQAESRLHLTALLDRAAGGVVFTTNSPKRRA